MFGMSEPEGPHAYVFIDSKSYVNVRQNCTYKNFFSFCVWSFSPPAVPSIQQKSVENMKVIIDWVR